MGKFIIAVLSAAVIACMVIVANLAPPMDPALAIFGLSVALSVVFVLMAVYHHYFDRAKRDKDPIRIAITLSTAIMSSLFVIVPYVIGLFPHTDPVLFGVAAFLVFILLVVACNKVS